eukprot:scaffold243821_cov28-Tisochrysis_lutea.AAC.1
MVRFSSPLARKRPRASANGQETPPSKRVSCCAADYVVASLSHMFGQAQLPPLESVYREEQEVLSALESSLEMVHARIVANVLDPDRRAKCADWSKICEGVR